MLRPQIPTLRAASRIIVLLMLIGSATTVQLQAINPCWEEVKHLELVQPYPVYVDTCLVNQGTQWIFSLYAKQDFEFVFRVATRVNSTPLIPNDSTIEITWNDISTEYSAIRSMLSDIENKFGSFYMRRKYPSDTSVVLANVYLVRFSNYVKIDSVLNTVLNANVFAEVRYELVDATLDVPNDRGLLPLEPDLSLRIENPPASNENDFWKNYSRKVDARSGTYIYRLSAAGRELSRTMQVVH